MGTCSTTTPALKSEGKKPFSLSSKPGEGLYQDFLRNEIRYSCLVRKFPDHAADLFAKSEAAAQALFDHLQKLVELYKLGAI